MKPRRPDDRRVSKALAVLDPPPANREKWAETIQSVLYPSSPSSPLGYVRHHFDEDDIPFERDRAGLTRYIAALRELKASRAALDPSTRRFLTLGEETVTFPFSGEVSVIEAEISEAEIMLKMSRRSLGKPVDIRARNAVGWARFVLGVCNLELTTERKGKWHLLSQIFAETSRDLRHHLAASLAKNPWRHDEIVVP